MFLPSKKRNVMCSVCITLILFHHILIAQETTHNIRNTRFYFRQKYNEDMSPDSILKDVNAIAENKQLDFESFMDASNALLLKKEFYASYMFLESAFLHAADDKQKAAIYFKQAYSLFFYAKSKE